MLSSKMVIKSITYGKFESIWKNPLKNQKKKNRIVVDEFNNVIYA